MVESISWNCAPCCWGVDDVSNPHLPQWMNVLDEAAEAGFRGLELGPYGYLPTQPEVLSAALQVRGLSIVAGTIFDDLVSADSRGRLLRQTEDICSLLTQIPSMEAPFGTRYPAPFLTVMDWGHEERDFNAGHSQRASRLNQDQWQNMIDNIRSIATLARDQYGIRAVIHPHAGGYIEFEDEIERVLFDIDAQTAGLCLDTGHLYYSGMDPLGALSRHWARVDYLHFKDIDPDVYRQVMSKRIRFFDACAEGVMCSIGKGCIDYDAIRTFLTKRGYTGCITIEQERDPKNRLSVLDDLKASRSYLAHTGFNSL